MTRVVVTGLGVVTPLGNDVPTTWKALIEGRSGIGYVTLFDTSAYDYAIAGEVRDFVPEAVMETKDLRHIDRYCQFAINASLEALRDAGIDVDGGLGERAGVVFGSGAGGYTLLEEQSRVLNQKGPRRVSPYFLSNILPDAASGYIAIHTGAMGPNMAVISACATGAGSIGEAAEIIKRGDADLMIAGGAEAPITPFLYAGFNALRAVASPGDDPSRACRPFDRCRDGFVVGEGAGCVVLESWEHAQARGARVYAELSGYGSSNDAFDMVASDEYGRGAALAMNMALRKSGLPLEQVGYVNAHGTATPMNDRVETLALKKVFGEHAYKLAVSSTKSMTGHMMGAAGAAEAIFSILALYHQVLPPTMHYQDPDPECDLDYVPNQARPVQDLEATLSTSIGLGGHNAALLFSRA
jgi:3-oxoacyl-[acyl-carrier-protein] synthase II